jgi:hypothetical protein
MTYSLSKEKFDTMPREQTLECITIAYGAAHAIKRLHTDRII